MCACVCVTREKTRAGREREEFDEAEENMNEMKHWLWSPKEERSKPHNAFGAGSSFILYIFWSFSCGAFSLCPLIVFSVPPYVYAASFPSTLFALSYGSSPCVSTQRRIHYYRCCYCCCSELIENIVCQLNNMYQLNRTHLPALNNKC